MATVKSKTKTTTKPSITKLTRENKRLRAVLFFLIKTHRVKPVGVAKGKTEAEINDMTLQTLDYMVETVTDDIVNEYKKACVKRTLNKMKQK